MTTEQAEAFAQLRARWLPRPAFGFGRTTRAGPSSLGASGKSSTTTAGTWAVFTDRPRVHAKLWAIPGVRRHQTGDREMRALFPHEALEQVAGVIRARRRRIQSPAQAQNLAKGPRSATSQPQDRADAGTLDLETSAGPEASAWRHDRDHADRLSGRTR